MPTIAASCVASVGVVLCGMYRCNGVREIDLIASVCVRVRMHFKGASVQGFNVDPHDLTRRLRRRRRRSCRVRTH